MNSQFSSNASNFSNALQTQVDPRTGQFTVNFPVTKLIGNHHLGPDLLLSLRYSPLNTADEGFGAGFSLGLTQFNNRSNLLELTSGEQYRVAPGSDKVRNKKLDNFRFAFSNGHDDTEGYTVIWKEGKIEKLTKTEDDKTFVTTMILSPLGRRLMLSWDWNGQASRLSKVKDENTTLCEIIYNMTVTKMTIWPGTREEYQLKFELINDSQLDNVLLPVSDSETLRWHFIYDDVKHLFNRLTLTGIDYPTGMKDRVEYNSQEGLHFPDSSGLNVRLPCVFTYTRSPGTNQPETIRQYEYTTQNFLGYNGNFGEWAADSDYLYKTLTDYIYGSTETVISGNVTVTTQRMYNNYHFLIIEEVNRNGHIHRTEITYYAVKNYFIDGQPAQFQLPKQKKETIQSSDGSKRELVTVTKFDESGNPLKQVDPDGTITEYTWYSVNGEKDVCPAEPNGFVRFLKEEVITPRSTIYTDTPSHITRYTYTKLGNTDYVAQKTISKYNCGLDMLLLTNRTISYQDDMNTSEFGRIISITDTKYANGENSKNFISQKDFTTSVSDDILNQELIFTGHDGLKSSFKRVYSSFSGLKYRQISSQGVETHYCYDKLGRVTCRTLYKNTQYENITTWEYGIDKDKKISYSIETDILGNKNKTCFDGSGRAISQLRFDADTTKWYEISTASHNSLGEVSSGTVIDYLPIGNPTNYPLTSNVIYGGWGNEEEVTFSDGRKTLWQTNPIALEQTVHSQGGTSDTILTSGNITTIFDKKSQLPIQKILQENTDGQLYSSCNYVWDGLGQLREETDELGHITKRTYDEYGRVLTQILADGTTIRRTYAPHLTGHQVASISVTGTDASGESCTWELGTRTFDSLGRIIKQVSGGRTTTYSYQDTSPQPSMITLPSGKTVQYTYIPELNNAVSSIKADGISQIFDYDKKTGLLLNAQEASSSFKNTWSQAGQLKGENFTHNSLNRETKHTYTLKGLPVSYTDVCGKETLYSMDEYGRVISIIDDSLTVDLTYDDLGRLNTQTVYDKVSAASLTTMFSYDSFGREITRTVTSKRGITLKLSQVWLENSLLAARFTHKNGIKLREEQYKYDERNRLINYTSSGDILPTDGYGYKITSQAYNYDALNNLTSVKTTLADSSTNTATYFYQNANDPTQLTMLTNTHKKYPKTINLSYDAEGRMTLDEAGRTLTYDVMGHLTGVSDEKTKYSSTYSYDALNRLINRNVGKNDTTELYYRGTELVNEVTTLTNKETRLIKTNHTCLGLSDGKGLTLTAGDQNDSLLWSEDVSTSDEGEIHIWSPYGSGKTNDRLPGYNGELSDPVSGVYHLGNGYRAYNPVLMRFNCPDSLSPFGAGGINPYAYCAGDPINHIDPSGHLSWQAIFGIALGAIGVGLAIFTAGASIAAAGGVMAAISSASASTLIIGGLGVISDITGIVSGAMEDSNPEASSILGWVSLGTGLAGMATGIGKWGAQKVLNRGSYNVAKASRQALAGDAESLFRSLDESVPTSRFHIDEPQISVQKNSFNPEGLLNNRTTDHLLGNSEPLRLTGGAPQYEINYSVIKKNPSRNAFRDMPDAAKEKYRDFTREIHKGKSPSEAASSIGSTRGSNLEKLKSNVLQNLYSIRLSQEHRAVFTISDPERIIYIQSVGSHYKNL